MDGETTIERRVRDVERDFAAHITNYENVALMIKDHEERMREIEKLVPALRAVMWVGSALGISIIGLIWALITGQVTLVF